MYPASASHRFLFSFSVVPHITDAIQEWVMRQALIPVDEDGLEPQVCVIEVCMILFFFLNNVSFYIVLCFKIYLFIICKYM